MTDKPIHWIDRQFSLPGWSRNEPSLHMLICAHYAQCLDIDNIDQAINAYIAELCNPIDTIETILRNLLDDVLSGTDFGMPVEHVDHPFHTSVMAARKALGIEAKHRITLTQADRQVASDWTRWHVRRAELAGWCMSDYDGTGALQLQKCDDQAVFKSDAEAIAHAMQLAYLGDNHDREMAALALRLDRYFEPIIYGKGYVSKIHTFPLNFTGGDLRPNSAERLENTSKT